MKSKEKRKSGRVQDRLLITEEVRRFNASRESVTDPKMTLATLSAIVFEGELHPGKSTGVVLLSSWNNAKDLHRLKDHHLQRMSKALGCSMKALKGE